MRGAAPAAPLHHGQVVIADGFVSEQSPPGVLDFARCPKIDDGGEPDGPEDVHIGVGQPVKPVAPEQPAPPGDLAVPGRIARQDRGN